jgi:hypothetical protein
VSYNSALISLSGLTNLVRVENQLQISGISALPNLAGLDALMGVGYLSITSNETLRSLLGLEALVSTDNVVITYNTNLTTPDGLQNDELFLQLTSLTIFSRGY